MSTSSNPNANDNLNPESFNAAFAVLQKNAKLLANAEDLDIDGLLPAVQESSAAAAICEARIKQVETALAEMFGNEAPAAQ